jgi:hypothetical protein
MTMLFEFFAVFAGFCAVMLACSLVVMFAVKGLHFLARERGWGLVSMLAELNLLYRTREGDFVRDGDLPQSDFVLDVLEHRLIDPEPVRTLVPLAERGPGRSQKAAVKIAQGRGAVSREDILSVVAELCEESAEGPVLPERWSQRLPATSRRYDTFQEFVLGRFAAVEATSTIRFRLRAKRVSVALSALLVVVLNLGTFRLADTLRRDAGLRETLRQAEPLLL